MLLSIAIHEEMTIFRVDVGSVFMWTPKIDNLKHELEKVDKRMVQMLMKL
jgi:hypothetical protein